MRQATPPHPHDPCCCLPQPALLAWDKVLVWWPSPLFPTMVSYAGGLNLQGPQCHGLAQGNGCGQSPLAVMWKAYSMARHRTYTCVPR